MKKDNLEIIENIEISYANLSVFHWDYQTCCLDITNKRCNKKWNNYAINLFTAQNKIHDLRNKNYLLSNLEESFKHNLLNKIQYLRVRLSLKNVTIKHTIKYLAILQLLILIKKSYNFILKNFGVPIMKSSYDYAAKNRIVMRKIVTMFYEVINLLLKQFQKIKQEEMQVVIKGC